MDASYAGDGEFPLVLSRTAFPMMHSCTPWIPAESLTSALCCVSPEVDAAYGYGYAEGMPMNGMHMEGDVPDDYAASIAYQYNEPY